jgi:RNA polymerase sigma-70 factor, ECF subfamily
MTPSPAPAPKLVDARPACAAAAECEALLRRRGRSADDVPGAGAPGMRLAATATAMMDEYRRTGSADVFEALVQLVGPNLLARVRSRLRFLGAQFDPHEVLQDAIINIYRYPDRFDASRPGAFAAWSSTIVDNTIRRQLRRQRAGVEVALGSTDMLAQHPGAHALEPDRQAQDHEECAQTLAAFRLLLQFYLAAFHHLSERERFVLQMVEVRQMRYAELAGILGIRPEALKMVVFRARRRVHERIAHWFSRSRGREQPLPAAG